MSILSVMFENRRLLQPVVSGSLNGLRNSSIGVFDVKRFIWLSIGRASLELHADWPRKN